MQLNMLKPPIMAIGPYIYKCLVNSTSGLYTNLINAWLAHSAQNGRTSQQQPNFLLSHEFVGVAGCSEDQTIIRD
jgi:hypothetical protein